MNTATRVAAAAATGYVLGRRKKLKLAIAVGSMLAGKRLATDPRGMMRQANELIESRPELAKISDQVRTTLFMAARGAAVGVVSNRINAVSDSIRERSERLTGAVTDKVPTDKVPTDKVPIGKGSADEDENEAEDAPEEKDESRRSRRARRDDDGGDGDGGDSGTEETTERTRPRQQAAKKAPAKKAPAKKAPAKKATSTRGDAPARKRTAKKTATKKSAAKKTSSSGQSSRSGTRG